MNVDIKPQEDGSLAITADREARILVGQLIDDGKHSDVSILWEITESYWANGSFYPFDGGEGNPSVGLTSAPCIAESMDVRDSGENQIVGRLWWFPNYAVENPSETLVAFGRVVFTLAPQST